MPQKNMSAAAHIWLIVLATLWLGFLLAISFLEAPLKFQAPGITVPLGLGIGRLVFAALNAVEGVLVLAISAVIIPALIKKIAGRIAVFWGIISAVYITKVAVIRPPLTARTEQVLAGKDPDPSLWHYCYIAADCVLVIFLLVFVVFAAKQLLKMLNSGSEA